MPILAKNKRAYYDYEILEKHEAGLMLSGNEVKSVRAGNISLQGAFISLKSPSRGSSLKLPELYLKNAHISPHQRHHETVDPTRERKLLLRRSEIRNLIGKQKTKGLTLIPISMYTKHAFIKLEFAVARGKKKHDKREAIKKREVEKEVRRHVKNVMRTS